jgi:large subunit ribosomal protein L29
MVEIRDRTDDELVVSLDRARDELFRLKLNRFTNQIENVMEIRQKRREVARILTVISARKKGLEAQAAAKEAKE